MAQATEYSRKANFRNLQALSPSAPTPGDKLDDEFNALKVTTDDLRLRQARIQRDDGQLANRSVGIDQIKPEIQIGLNPPSVWVPNRQYDTRDTVLVADKFYFCEISHVSNVDFAVDLAAGRWSLLADFGISASSVRGGVDAAYDTLKKLFDYFSLVRAVADGGTGATTAADARANLGIPHDIVASYDSAALTGLSSLIVNLPTKYSRFQIRLDGIALTADGIIRLRCGPAGGALHAGAADYAMSIYGRQSVDGAVSATAVGSSADIAGAGTTNDQSVDISMTDGGLGGKWRAFVNLVGKTSGGVDYAQSRGVICNVGGVKKQLQFVFTQPIVSGNVRIYGEV